MTYAAWFNSIYPLIAIGVILIAAASSLLGGILTGVRIMQLEAEDPGQKTGQIFGGFFVIIVGCAAALLSLYIGGKFLGSF